MKRFLKYLIVVLAAAAAAYVAYRYRRELVSLAERAVDWFKSLKTKLCAFREEQNDFADL